MSNKGGISTLKGVRYEIQTVIYKIPELLDGRLSAIRYQPHSSALSADQPPTDIFVDDYSTQDKKGQKSFFQAKQNTKDVSWTVRRLLDEGVLEQFWNQHCVEPESSLFFVSNIPAPQLQSLVEHAQQTVSSGEFQKELTKEGNKNATLILEELQITWESLWCLLKTVDYHPLTEGHIHELIINYASKRYNDPNKFALALKNLIENSPGRLISKDVVISHLENNGIFSRLPSLPQDIRTILRQASVVKQTVATSLKKWRILVVVALRDVGDISQPLVSFLEENNFTVSLVSDVETKLNHSKVLSELTTTIETSDFTMFLVDNRKLEEVRSVIRNEQSSFTTTAAFVNLSEDKSDNNIPSVTSMSETVSESQEDSPVLPTYYFRNLEELISLARTVLRAFSRNVCLQILQNQVKAVRSTRTIVGLMLSIGDIIDREYYIDGPFTVDSGSDTASSVSDLLEQARRLRSCILIRGAPGIGKSTALAKAFLSHAYKALQNHERDSMPFYVSLRGLGKQYHFSFEAYIQECCRKYFAKEIYPLFDLEIVNPVLYIDGFDEITEQYHKLEMQRVVTSDFFSNSVVLCSRKKFSDAVMASSLAFASLFDTIITLDDWSSEAIWLYISKFCENQNAHELFRKLKRAYADSPHPNSIFRNPLLLNMFLWVVKDAEMQLPPGVDDATSLFHEFVNRWAIRELLRYSTHGLPGVEADAHILMQSWYISAWQIYRARLRSEKIFFEKITNSVGSKIPGSSKLLSKPAFSNMLDIQRFSGSVLGGSVLGMIHEQFIEYFVAVLFVEGCLEAKEPYPEYLQYGTQYQINSFIKGIWKGLGREELLRILGNLWRAFQESLDSDSTEAVNTATNAAYYISRIPLPDAVIEKLRLADQLTETKKANLYIRNGVLWGLMRLGDWQSEEKLYVSYISDEEADRLNRGLHLIYFGDCNEPSPYYDDCTHEWTLTLNGLLSHIQSNEPRFLYTRRIDIYIIRSLVESRKDRGPLTSEHLKRIEESVQNLKNMKDIVDESFIRKVNEEFALLKSACQKFGTK